MQVRHTVDKKIKVRKLPTNTGMKNFLNMYVLLDVGIKFHLAQPRITLSSERWTKAREETDARSTIYAGDVSNLLRE